MRICTSVCISLVLAFWTCTAFADDDIYVISTDRTHPNFPREVVRFGGGDSFEIKDLDLRSENGRLKASFSYIGRVDAGEFEIVLCTETEDEFLITFFHEDSRVSLFTPAGSAGDVALTMGGYENEETQMSNSSLVPKGYKCGQFRLSLATDIYGSYDIGGKVAKVTVFIVKKNDYIRDERFQAVSDVLKGEVTTSR